MMVTSDESSAREDGWCAAPQATAVEPWGGRRERPIAAPPTRWRPQAWRQEET